jgi:hypothetical protein
VRVLLPSVCVDAGLVKRVRGVAYATRVSPQTANRMVECARGLLNRCLPDVFIYTDHYRGAESGMYVPPLPGVPSVCVCVCVCGCLCVCVCMSACVHVCRWEYLYVSQCRSFSLPFSFCLCVSRSPGFGLSLVAESTTGVLLHCESYAAAGETPEDVGRRAAKGLIREISKVRSNLPSHRQ